MKLTDISPVVIVYETDDALLVKWDPDINPVWVPKKAVEYDPSDQTLTLPVAMAEEKGMV